MYIGSKMVCLYSLITASGVFHSLSTHYFMSNHPVAGGRWPLSPSGHPRTIRRDPYASSSALKHPDLLAFEVGCESAMNDTGGNDLFPLNRQASRPRKRGCGGRRHTRLAVHSLHAPATALALPQVGRSSNAVRTSLCSPIPNSGAVVALGKNGLPASHCFTSSPSRAGLTFPSLIVT
jgi:hypothetical protein